AFLEPRYAPIILSMSVPLVAPPPSLPEAPLCSTQPGGGWCMRLELAWGRLRRACLRRFRPEHVARLTAKRKGQCENCPGQNRGCQHDVIDPRDLKYFRNICGYYFDPADDPTHGRSCQGFARPGVAELVIFAVIALLLGVGLALAGWLGLPHWLAGILG